MSKYGVKIASLCIALSGATGTGVAQAAATGLYLGIDAGEAEARDTCNDISNCDNSDTSVRAEIGFQFTRVVGIELGYTSFGTLFEANNNTFNAKQEASAMTASLLLTLPVTDAVGIYARAGAARYNIDNSGTIQGIPVGSDDSTKPYYGAGVEFDLSDHFMLRGEYQVYRDISGVDGSKDDVHAWYAGVGFRL